MNRAVVTAVMLAALSSRVSGGPLGIEASLEAGGDDLLNPKDSALHVQPGLSYAPGDTGLRFESFWEIPVYPGLAPGTVELLEEYELVVPGVVITFGNDNTLAVDSGDLEGFVSVTAEHDIADLSLALELDTGYTPDFSIDAVATLAYEWKVGRGTLGIGVEQTIPIYSRLEWGDSDFTVTYEIALFGLVTTLEVEPIIIAGGGLALGARLLVVLPL